MNPILDMLTNAAGGGALQQVGQRFGLSTDQTTSVLNQLVPALVAGMHRNTTEEGGEEKLQDALSNGNHADYLDHPELLGENGATEDGNSILGHIFGTKDVSRAVANSAAQQTGIGADIVKQMLPVVAAMVMGGLSKQNAAIPGGGAATGLQSILGSLLSQNNTGGMAGEVVGMLGRLLGGRS